MDPQAGWRRNDHLGRLDDDFDLIVIGGGIVGAGVALDATHRGKKVAIVDRGDWAGGTSSRSTKLLHGGVRYLPQMRFGLIRRGLKEQRILGAIADYLVEPIDFVIPVYRNEGALRPTHDQLQEMLTGPLKGYAGEFIFVDDGSDDASLDELLAKWID